MAYARLSTFVLGPGMRATGEKITGEMAPQIKGRKGFKDVYFIGDDATGEYGAFILWETKEDAESAKEVLLPIVQSKISGIAKGPPVVKLFEVYTPK
jgi:heme-degrading monooxygenase HmoA